MADFKLEGEYSALADLQEKEQEGLFRKQNVVGVGVGHKIKAGVDTGDPCVTVFVRQKLDPVLLSGDDAIDKTIGKFKTDVVETGEIFAGAPTASAPPKVPERARVTVPRETRVSEPRGNGAYFMTELQEVVTPELEEVTVEALRQRVRPVEGGYSIGHYRVTAGTMATAVYDRVPFPGIPRRYYVLSNNHVLANTNMARVGDPILQPGPADGGTYPADRIARLSRFITITFQPPFGIGAPNLVDAAIAEGEFHDLDREVYWIGYAKDVLGLMRGAPVWPTLGDRVQKTGRTTSFTTGEVIGINAMVNVNYGSGRIGRFIRQIVTSNMSAPGDSGSLLFDFENKALGLLFAGSSEVTIHNHIWFVENLLKIRIV